MREGRQAKHALSRITSQSAMVACIPLEEESRNIAEQSLVAGARAAASAQARNPEPSQNKQRNDLLRHNTHGVP